MSEQHSIRIVNPHDRFAFRLWLIRTATQTHEKTHGEGKKCDDHGYAPEIAVPDSAWHSRAGRDALGYAAANAANRVLVPEHAAR